MSILINGMEMPTERESFNLTIKYNGVVLDTETGTQVAEAHELPPHGRLIDTDAVSLEGGPYEYDEWCKWALEQYQDAPTIIPAAERAIEWDLSEREKEYIEIMSKKREES